jgi:drug/metabolite transporter (DMT)-like permease
MQRILVYSYIVLTISLTAYGQLILKARFASHAVLPNDFGTKLWFLLHLLFDLLIFSGFVAGFLASISWMAAMTKFDISHAYPSMSLNFVIALVLGGWLFSESITLQKSAGVSLIGLERRSRREG